MILVHSLRIGDLKVVAALGDSITSANGAKAAHVFDVLTEYRGRAFRSVCRQNLKLVEDYEGPKCTL